MFAADASQRNMSFGCPQAGDPDFNVALQLPECRTRCDESLELQTSSGLGECAGCYIQQRERSDERSDDEGIDKSATRRYEFARPDGHRGPLDQFDCRSLDFTTAQVLAIAGRTLPKLGGSSRLGAEDHRPSVGRF